MHRFILLIAASTFATNPVRAAASDDVTWRAAASDDATCAAEATSVLTAILTRAGVVDVERAIAAGCDDADVDSFCAVRGTAGPCSSNPACPQNQLSSFGCTSAKHDAGCCIEHLRKPCQGCEPVVTECLSLCGGPPPPARDPVVDRLQRANDRAQDICAYRAAESLPSSADASPGHFTAAGCDHADTLVTCDLLGAFAPCEDISLCDDVGIITDNCTAHSTANSCCTIFFAPLCAGCEPEVEFCRQQCLDTPPIPTGLPAAAGAAPVDVGAAFTCASGAAAVLEALALMNPEGFAVGCDRADPWIRCDIRTSIGGCEANPGCPANHIDPGKADPGPPPCCAAILARPCRDCDPVPMQCLAVTPSESPKAPAVSTAEWQRRECIDAADISLAALRAEDPDFVASSCETADPGQACGVAGAAGPCSAAPACRSLEVVIGESCSLPRATEEDGCCMSLVAPPCPGCTPVPLECVQTCF